MRADDFSLPQTKGTEIAPGLNKHKTNLRLYPGTAYHWRIGHGNKWSGTASFETPYCPVYDEAD